MNKAIPAGLACALLMGMAGCGSGGKPAAPQAPPAPEVGVLVVAPRSVGVSVELPGRTSPYRVAEVRPQVGGILQKRLFAEGSEVAAGAPLYQIDPATYRAAASGARATLASVEAQAANAKVIADRAEKLFSQKLISQQDHDNALTTRRRTEADVGVAKAAVEAAEINLAYTTIRSPIAGTASRSRVTEGALLKALQDDAITTVQQLDPIYVDLTQSSAELLGLQRELAAGRLKAAGAQPKVTLILEDGSAYSLPGTLQFAETVVDRGTGSVLMRALFPNPKRELLPGMYVRAKVVQGTAEQALLVPQGGVTRNAKGEAVVLLVDESGSVTDKVIHTGRVVDNQWLVTDGLKGGEHVIVEGLQKAKPGMKVRAVPVKQD
jgi:membrane fusion protein (multidrug efflux system)